MHQTRYSTIRAVQTTQKMCKRMNDSHQKTDKTSLILHTHKGSKPWLLMPLWLLSFRCSPSFSTRFSPGSVLLAQIQLSHISSASLANYSNQKQVEIGSRLCSRMCESVCTVRRHKTELDRQKRREEIKARLFMYVESRGGLMKSHECLHRHIGVTWDYYASTTEKRGFLQSD